MTSSKMGKYKNSDMDKKNIQGRCIINTEILHVVLKYPEVMTNIKFIAIKTMPLNRFHTNLSTNIIFSDVRSMPSHSNIP